MIHQLFTDADGDEWPTSGTLELETTPTHTVVEHIDSDGIVLRRWAFNHSRELWVCTVCGLPVGLTQTGAWHNASTEEIARACKERGVHVIHAVVPVLAPGSSGPGRTPVEL